MRRKADCCQGRQELERADLKRQRKERDYDIKS